MDEAKKQNKKNNPPPLPLSTHTHTSCLVRLTLMNLEQTVMNNNIYSKTTKPSTLPTQSTILFKHKDCKVSIYINLLQIHYAKSHSISTK